MAATHPATRADNDSTPDNSPEAIYEALRSRILSGHIAAGSVLVQAKIAVEFGVSRGPVREAFRLLQREGLIVSEVNLRARVAELSAAEVDHLYALRVVNEALALSVSVPRFTADELTSLAKLATDIAGSEPENFNEWEALHEQFHNLLISHCGASLQASLRQWSDYTERYRRVYVSDRSGGWMLGSREHRSLATACSSRDVTAAVGILVEHLGRAGLTLIAMIDPRYEPVLVRAAMQQVSNAPPTSNRKRK
ncbi:MAG: GntR family transcriptional regulator [Actinomycetes bacterium]|jgi:DNA-binding GntR family transcriptional regulator